MEFEKLRLESNDILVLSTELTLSEAQAAELKGKLRKELGGEHRILVLSSGLKLAVLNAA